MNGLYSIGGKWYRVCTITTKCTRILTAGLYRRRENTIRKLKTKYALTVVLKQVLTNENENKNYILGSQKPNKNFVAYTYNEFDPLRKTLLTNDEYYTYCKFYSEYKACSCLCAECVSLRKMYLRCLIAFRMLGLRRWEDSLVPAIEATCHADAPSDGSTELGESEIVSGPSTSSSGDAATTGTSNIIRDVGAGGAVAAVSSFHDAQVGDVFQNISLPSNPEDHDIESIGTELREFLKRPVLIHTYGYGSSTPSQITVKPWSLFLNAIPIRKKIDNYAFFRGTLKVKTVVNCSPFFYGAVFYSYYPQSTLVPTGGASNIPQVTQANNYLVEPQKSKGGEMTLPFFYFSKVCQLNTTSTDDLGTLVITPTTALRSASTTAPQTVQLRTYAWMEDVELLATTAWLQGKGPKGPAEQPSMSVAKTLTSLPVVGSVFKTVGETAKTIGSIAGALGFSSEPTAQCTEPFTNRAAPAMAVSDLDRPIEKLTLDHQNETNMDPTSVGLEPTDEMDMQYVLRKESCLGWGQWVPESTTINTTLISFAANPLVRTETVVTPGLRAIVAPPMGYIAPLFQLWRGSLHIRMKIIRTTYHRGRLKVTWDPLSGGGPSNADYHTRKTHIIDIEEQDEFEFDCPFQNRNVWAEVGDPLGFYSYLKFNDGQAAWDDNTSGIFNVSVETPLISAGGTEPIIILFYLRAGTDFEFAKPRKSLDQIWSTYNPNPIPVGEGRGVDAELQGSMELGKKVSNTMPSHSSHVGEKVYSLRSLCERMAFHRTEYQTATEAGNGFLDMEITQNAMPWGRGYYNQDDLAGGSKVVYYLISAFPGNKAAFENVSTPVVTWITNMYAGRRGSVNYYFVPQSFNNASSLMWASRSENGWRQVYSKATIRSNPDESVDTFTESRAGATYSVSATDSIIRTSVPNYNKQKFYIVNRALRDGYGGLPSREMGVTCGIRIPVANATEDVWTTVFVASGHDFQCFYFTYCPTFWISDFPTPTPA